jgi:hypothetical protein
VAAGDCVIADLGSDAVRHEKWRAALHAHDTPVRLFPHGWPTSRRLRRLPETASSQPRLGWASCNPRYGILRAMLVAPRDHAAERLRVSADGRKQSLEAAATDYRCGEMEFRPERPSKTGRDLTGWTARAEVDGRRRPPETLVTRRPRIACQQSSPRPALPMI